MISENLNKKLELLIIIFIGLSFISSQLSVALSSIGIVGLIILFSLRIILNKGHGFHYKILLYLIIVFFCWQLFTSLVSSDPSSAIAGTLKKASLYIVILASITFIRSKKQLTALLTVFFVFSALVSAYETIRYLIDFNSQSEHSLADFRLAYFGHPITIAEIKMIVLLIMLPFVLSKEKFILNKWLLVFLSVPILLSLYFTNTRNAVLGLFAGILIIGIMKHRMFLLGCIAGVVLFLYFAPAKYTERIESIVEITHPSNEARFRMWETGLKMIADKPITGFGDVDILTIYKTYRTPETFAEGTHMHNNFVQITVLYGITGLVIWLLMIIYIMVKQFRVYNKVKGDEYLRLLTLSSIACMFAFIISGLTEWNFGDAEFAAVFWFVFSFPFIAENLIKQPVL